MAIVQDELYIMGGYGKDKGYAGDAWKLKVSALLCGTPAVCSNFLARPIWLTTQSSMTASAVLNSYETVWDTCISRLYKSLSQA